MIKYKVGDALHPTETGCKLIIHCCNDVGGFGAGFAGAIAQKFNMVQAAYYTWGKESAQSKIIHNDVVFTLHYPPLHTEESECCKFELGKVQVVEVVPNIMFANMIAQHNILNDERNRPPVRYDALVECLDRIRLFVNDNGVDVIIAPRICSGLAGGRWKIVEAIIEEHLCRFNIPVTIYDLE